MQRVRKWDVVLTIGLMLVGSGAWGAMILYDITDLGTLGGNDSYGRGINVSGQVTGYSDTTGNSAQHAFLYSGGAMTDLGTLGGSASYGRGINASDQVTGTSDTTGNSAQHAFLYSDNAMWDLNDWLAPDSLGWELIAAYGINDSGQITGYGIIGGKEHAFLATPQDIPEPSSCALFLLGALPIGFAWWRRRRA